MTKQNLIRFWINYIKNLIALNKVKFIILTVGILLYSLGTSMDKSVCFYRVDKHFIDNGIHFYDLTYYKDALVYDTEQRLFEDKGEFFIKSVEWSELGITTMVFAYIAFAIVLISCFVNESDINLELTQVLKDTIYNDYKISEIEEDGDTKYYHTSYSKILRVKTNRNGSWDTSHLDKFVSETTMINIVQFILIDLIYPTHLFQPKKNT